MLCAATIGVLLALAPLAAPPAASTPPAAAVAPAPAPAAAAAAPASLKTLWVVQPLYPGQELLVSRTEEAMRRLMASSTDQLIGVPALSEHLKGKTADLRCLTGDEACADPVDGFVASLGLERVVMVKAGQEDTSYRVKVTSYVPQTGETAFAEGVGPALDRALMSALVKVVALASTIEIVTNPPGATVFIDGERVGVTPYEGQVLPGERLVKVEAASHMPAEKKFEVPIRGRLKIDQSLEKVPARIVLAALPAGAAISIDGVKMGVDKVDKAIQPGRNFERSPKSAQTKRDRRAQGSGDSGTNEPPRSEPPLPPGAILLG